MLYVIQKGYNGVLQTHPENIVYIRVTIQAILDSEIPFVYIDGHAIDAFTNTYYPEDISALNDQIDFKAARSKYWRDDNDLDLKRRKEAEFLILNDLSFDMIHGFAVYNEDCKFKLIAMKIPESKITITPELYF